MSPDTKRSIAAMVRPTSIAVIGATDRLYGGRIMKNLLQGGFKGKLYPVNPKRDDVFGLPCFPSIRTLPEPVDSAAILVPAAGVPGVLQECAERGVKAAIIISAGFAEMGDAQGQQLQLDVRRIARETGVRVCGPNCLGVSNIADGIWSSANPTVAADVVVGPGPVALVSQSGATAHGPLMALARDRGIGFRYVISTGNEADLELTDFVEFLLEDPEVKSIALMVEGFRDAPKFVRVARLALDRGTPLVVLKLGRSAVGAGASRTHTGALTGSDAVQTAMFRQCGVVRVDDYDELVEVAAMFAKSRVPEGERVGLVSHGGGICGAIGDNCGGLGLTVPALTDRTLTTLQAILEGRGAAANPADITFHGARDTFPVILEAMLADDNIDLLGIATAGTEATARAVIDTARASQKPVLFMWTDRMQDALALPLLQRSEVPVFYLPGRFAKGIRSLVDYKRARQRYLEESRGDVSCGLPTRTAGGTATAEVMDLLQSSAGHVLDEHRSKAVLSLLGIPVTREVLCKSFQEAESAAAELGFPVVLKAASVQIPHKTEARAIRLDVRDTRELTGAWDAVLANARAFARGATIDGVLVQEMVTGSVEVIAGLAQDPQFGPVLLCGIGGIFVEALGAVARRLCPITPADAREMIAEVPGMQQILGGYRRRPAADVDALIDALCRLSHAAVSAGGLLAEVDINPLAVLPKGQGVKALDALVVVGDVTEVRLPASSCGARAEG
jgi:acetate---CoA ligase (ADP-forming)